MSRKYLKRVKSRLLRPVAYQNELLNKIIDLGTQQKNLIKDQSDALRKLEKKIENSGVLQLPSGEVMTKIFSGAKMYLDPHDIALVPHLVLDGDWERNITKAWLNVIRSGDTVVDIGANFGYFGILAAQQTNKQCKVISFEANPNLIPYLRKNYNVNGFDKLSVIENLAVSDKPGKATLSVLQGYIGSSSLHDENVIRSFNRSNPNMEIASKIGVKSISLDSYCKRAAIKSLDLIKMDIEGFEDRAYEGMRRIVSDSPRLTLFVEFTKQAYKNPKRFYEQMLADFGNVFLIDEEGGLFKPKENSYSHVVDDKDADWVMPVFSKIDLLKSSKFTDEK